MSAEVAVLWLLVFIIGVAVGIIAIMAIATMRKDNKGRDNKGRDNKDRMDQADPDDDQWPERDHRTSGIPGRWDAGARTENRKHWPQAPDDQGKS